MVIQQLLVDAGAKDLDMDLVMVDPQGLEVAADWRSLRSPETYLGYGQSSGFVAEDSAFYDRSHVYEGARDLQLNSWDLTGDWTVAQHAAVLNAAGGRITFAFHARDVNLVMGPATAGASIPFRVLLDGHGVDGANGTDVDADGRGVLADQNTYQLIRQTGDIDDAHLRDRVPRGRGGGVLLHVRVIGAHARARRGENGGEPEEPTWVS